MESRRQEIDWKYSTDAETKLGGKTVHDGNESDRRQESSGDGLYHTQSVY
jgi:hypothetical protein